MRQPRRTGAHEMGSLGFLRADAVLPSPALPRYVVSPHSSRKSRCCPEMTVHPTPLRKTKRAADCSAALIGLGMTYFRFVIAVRSAESLTMPVAPHHPDSKPPGLIGETLAAVAVVAV